MNPALLCQTVTGRTMAELVAARDAAEGADLVELRLDSVEHPVVAEALAGRKCPVILTCRPTWEGGWFTGSADERKVLLRQALELGAEYVDVEWQAGFDDLITAFARRIVVSSHDFSGVPVDLAERARAMRQTGAGTIKIAIAADSLADTLPLLEIGRAGNAVVIGMGPAGIPSRLLASHFGSLWSYAGDGVAPGQVPAARMRDEFRFTHLTSETTLFGVVGNNVLHSLSPAMHNAAFAVAGIDAAYVPLPTDDFSDFLRFASALRIAGASVTIPFKLDALAAATQVDRLARTVGAANTLRRRGEEWEATNTDVDGFLEPLERVYPQPLDGVRVSVLGGGGAARAVIVGLLSRGSRVTVHTRRPEQAGEAIGPARASVGPWPPARGSWDLLVNCTPLGSAARPNETPLPDGPLEGRMVYDLTYGAQESPLLAAARQAGCLTLDGLPMLVTQAERQFAWWTGQRPQQDVMRAAARHALPASPQPSHQGDGHRIAIPGPAGH